MPRRKAHSAAGPSDPTALYRYFDNGNRLLYLGISGSLAHRELSHVAASLWMDLAARSEISRYPSRARALEAEREAIETERPLFNRKHNDTPGARSRLRSYLNEIGRLDLLPPAQQATENGLRKRPSKVTPAANTIEIVRADANLSRWLQLDEGQLVAIRRPIRGDRQPDSLCDSYYPMDLAQEVPGILNPAEDHQSVTRLMGERGYEEVRHVDELRWRSPTPEESAVLDIPAEVVVLVQARTGYTAARAVWTTVTTRSGDRHTLIYELSA